nr:DUF4105 domain-containing protein [Variovorax boronicumulans]
MMGRAAWALVLLLSSLWAVPALHHRLPLPAPWGSVVAGGWALFALAAIWLLWREGAARPVLAYGVAFALLLGWWVRIAPSDARVWADDVARHLEAQVEGGVVLLSNVRNFDWRSDTDYTARWEARRFDLDRLRTVDMALSYGMGPPIAHTLVSFGFDDGQRIVFSVEIRKQPGESFSAVAGLFKQYELSLVAADERDILRVRTNVRGEDVYLYRVQLAPAAQRALFLAQAAHEAVLDAWLETARHAYAYLFLPPRKPRERALEDRQTQMRDYYNDAVQQTVTRLLKVYSATPAAQRGETLAVGGWRIASHADDSALPPDAPMPDELLPASSLRFTGLRNTCRREGFGAEIVAVLPPPADADPALRRHALSGDRGPAAL